MSVKVVNLKDFAAQLGVDNQARAERFRKAITSGIAKSIPALVAATPVDRGQMAQSWMFEEKEWGTLLGNYAPHAAIVENGARAHWAPIGPLLAWAKRVLGDPSQPPEYSSRVWALAKYTQKKIHDQDTPPKHILQNLIPQILQNIKDEYEHGQLDDHE